MQNDKTEGFWRFSMDKVIQELKELEVGKVLENEPLSNHTTIKIGGPADVLVVPKNIQAVKDTMKVIKKHGVKWTAIGRGSNLLVLDEGIRGVVIKLGQGLDHMEIDGEQVTVGGGYSVVRLATGISKKGLSGLEFAAGIPGSVGGAVYMNAGAHGSDISRVLVKALILFEDGTIDWLTNEEMAFSYRTSILQNERPGICLEAVLQLEQKNAMRSLRKCRKTKTTEKKRSLCPTLAQGASSETRCLNMRAG